MKVLKTPPVSRYPPPQLVSLKGQSCLWHELLYAKLPNCVPDRPKKLAGDREEAKPQEREEAGGSLA